MPKVLSECLSHRLDSQKALVFRVPVLFWQGSWSPCARLAIGIDRKPQVSAFQSHYEFDWSDQAHPYLETTVFLLSVKIIHTQSPKCPFFHCNTHPSLNIKELDTNGSKCNPCKVQDYACLYKNPDRLLWRDFLWLICFRVWYLGGKCLFDAWNLRLWGPGTCKTWFFDRWEGFFYFLTLNTNSYPWVKRQVPIFLHNERNTWRFVIECFDHLDNVFMGGEDVKSLNLLEFFDFLKGIKLFFHTLDGNMFSCFEG